MTSRGLVMTFEPLTFKQLMFEQLAFEPLMFENRFRYPTRARPNAFLIQHIFLLNTDALKHQGNHYV